MLTALRLGSVWLRLVRVRVPNVPQVEMDDFLSALAGVVPSVSVRQLEYYESLRQKFAPGATH